MTNANGVPNGMVIIATNAGFLGTTAWAWRNHAMTSEEWSVLVYSHPAPWHTEERLNDERHMGTGPQFNRLWKGQWISGVGDAVKEEKIEKAFSSMTGPLSGPEDGWDYVVGLDVGVKHDHCAVAVLGLNAQQQRIKVGYWQSWQPEKKRTGEVDLIDVEETLIKLWKLFNVRYIFYDPSQAIFMAQRLRRIGARCVEVSFSSQKNMIDMATAFIQLMEAERIDCYDDSAHRLRWDFGKFKIEHKSYGYRLTAVSDNTGHADVGTAVVIALPYAVDHIGFKRPFDLADNLIAVETARELNPEEVQEMPDELREIYEAEDKWQRKNRLTGGVVFNDDWD